MINYTLNAEPTKHDCLIVPVWEDKGLETAGKKLDEKFDGLFSSVIKSKDFVGQKRQMSMLYTKDKATPRVLLVGLGKQKALDVKLWKRLIGSAVIAVQSKKMKKIGFVMYPSLVKKFGPKQFGTQVATSVETANYAFDDYKEKKAKVIRLTDVELIGSFDATQKRNIQKGIDEGVKIAEGVNFLRMLGNTPPSEMTPERIAKEAVEMAKKEKGLKVTVLSQPEIEKLGMGCFLGVASGSQHEPKFIILEYWGAGNKKQKPTVLVGKGITFDSGGLSLKPGDYMCDMKFDMLGAATVISTMKVVASLGLKKNIIGLTPTCENMPGGEAYRPDDILTAMNGKTVEVKNTDAEGRLILSDALCYAKKYEPALVIDFATLTGACMVAVGTERNGIFSNDKKIADKLYDAGQATGEEHWPLPLGDEYHEWMKSNVADISNISSNRYGGASTAAAFLEFFTDYPWAHFDLAGSYHKGKGKPWIRHGANGVCVQTMVEFLR